jgi:hypothetical protein
MLGLSLLTFRHPKHTASKIIRAASGALTPPKQGWIGANGPVLLMYMPVHFFFTLWVLSFVFMPQTVALSLWAAFLVPYYVFTHQGNPAHTGACGWCLWWFVCLGGRVEGARFWLGSDLLIREAEKAHSCGAGCFKPRTVALSLWIAFLVPYYVITHQGNPAHTGLWCSSIIGTWVCRG